MGKETRGREPAEDVDPLAAFDALLDTVADEVKEKKVKPKREKKKEKEEIIIATTERAQTFGRLAKEGTYEELRGVSFEMFLTAAAREVGAEAPPDLERKLAELNGIGERLDRYDGLEESAKEDSRLKAAVDILRQNAETTMREWASLLQEQFEILKERNEFERDATEDSIRGILDSSVFTAEVRVEDETYGDYKRRVAEATVDALARRAQALVGEMAFNGNMEKMKRHRRTGMFDQIQTEVREGRISIEAVETKFNDFEDGVKEIKAQNLINYEEPREILKLARKIFGFSYSQGDATRRAEQLNEKIPKVRTEVERAKNSGEIAKASLELFAEEKMQNIIRIIEEEIDSEEERHTALGFVKQHFSRMSIDLNNVTSKRVRMAGEESWFYVQLKFPTLHRDKDGNVPPWLLKCLKEYNEIKLFRDMLIPRTSEERIQEELLVDQALRALTEKEPTENLRAKINNNTTDSSISIGVTLSTDTYIQNTYVGEVPSKLTLDPNLLVRATATAELLGHNGAYDEYRDKDSLKNMRTSLGNLSKDTPFNPKTGEPGAYSRKQTAEDKKWREDIDIRRHAQKPTSREDVDRVIEDNDGVYPIATVNESVRLVEALKTEVVVALQKAEKIAKEGRLAGEQGIAAGQQVAEAAKTEVEGLRKSTKNEVQELQRQLNEALGTSGLKIDGLKGELAKTSADKNAREQEIHAQRQRAETSEESAANLKRELANKKRELTNLKKLLAELAKTIESGVAGAQELRGTFGGADNKKQRAALENLVGAVQSTLKGLS